jgi:hypothetical protein
MMLFLYASGALQTRGVSALMFLDCRRSALRFIIPARPVCSIHVQISAFDSCLASISQKNRKRVLLLACSVAFTDYLPADSFKSIEDRARAATTEYCPVKTNLVADNTVTSATHGMLVVASES